MSVDERLAEVRHRIDLIRTAFGSGHLRTAAPPKLQASLVHFEIEGSRYDVATIGGVPQTITPRGDAAEWAIVVDDWARIVPVEPPRGLSDHENCGIRYGDELYPMPMNFEAERWNEQYFPERVPNALLYLYIEGHGTPVGSLTFAVLLREGVPEYQSDTPNPQDEMPKMAMGAAWPKYNEYRRGRAHQLSITDGSWIDGNWKDLLVLHGLFDAEGFARIYAEYPEMPDAVMDYSWVLAEAAKLPEARPERPVAEGSDDVGEGAVAL